MTDYNCRLPGNVTIELTEFCNLRCKMCYFWGETGAFSEGKSERKPVVMELDLLERIVKELTPARTSYSLFGGEPLSYPHLEQMIDAMKKAGSFIDTPTNGTLLEKNAPLLVETAFDSIRVSMDGPRDVNDSQRGKGAYDKAMAGIEALHSLKQKSGKTAPVISIIYTITPENYLSIEQFFLKELNLDAVGWITIQMQNFITEEMGQGYSKMLRDEFGLTGNRYWGGMVRNASDFYNLDTVELARQVGNVKKRMEELGKNVMLLPKKFTPENLTAYLAARWTDMQEKYRKCPMPRLGTDITATGEIAPCHIFFDLVMGDLHEKSFEEIWNGEKFKSFRAYMDQHGLMPICHGCCVLYMVGF